MLDISRSIQQLRQPQEQLGGQRVARRHSAVDEILAPRDQHLVVVRGLEEAGSGRVAELRQDRLGQAGRSLQPAQLEGGLVERDQPQRHGRVVFQVGVEVGAAVFGGAVETDVEC